MRKYIDYIVIGIKEHMVYPSAIWAKLFSKIIYLYLQFSIWTALFFSHSQINPLTRPISPFVYLVLQKFQYTFLPRLFFSVFFWIYSLQNLQIKWTVIAVFHYCVSLLSAFAIFSAITVITGTISFWTVKSEEIVSLLTDNNYGLKNFCDYPIQIYSKGIQFLLTFIVPYALTGYYPVAYLLGKDYPYLWIAYISPVIAFVMAIIACIFWHIGLKHYGGTGA